MKETRKEIEKSLGTAKLLLQEEIGEESSIKL
jgi:hypothetical protein